jgi:hypothetical protein
MLNFFISKKTTLKEQEDVRNIDKLIYDKLVLKLDSKISKKIDNKSKKNITPNITTEVAVTNN